LNQVSSAQANEDRSVLLTIHYKVTKAWERGAHLELDIADLSDDGTIAHYTHLREAHDRVVRTLADESGLNLSGHRLEYFSPVTDESIQVDIDSDCIGPATNGCLRECSDGVNNFLM
jgi:hypothetical protein